MCSALTYTDTDYTEFPPISLYKCNNHVTVKFVSWVGDVCCFIRSLDQRLLPQSCLCLCACFSETGLVVFIVSLVVGILLFLVLVIGSLICCIRKRRPAKRYRKKFLFFSLLSTACTSSHIDKTFYPSLILVSVCISV